MGFKSEVELEKSQRSEMLHHHKPLRHWLITFIAFIVAGFLPLIPYVFNLSGSFRISIFVVGFSLLVVGIIRGKITGKNPVFAGLEVLFVGGIAAIVAYGVGFLIDKYLI